ncbi:transcriptional repressor [Gammaproteobacteria bacterium]|jgi:Fur family zinc uptake transcriptional regulator|nr:transcriptional repressor [Gammaproteobacteria bacterium]
MSTARHQLPPQGHDHAGCIETAMSKAELLCRDRGLRLTALRRRVLELVWASHKPIGAYDILGRLGGNARTAAPPTVYRALEFLIEAGLVHRLDSLNAFVGCPDPGRMHTGQFLICRECRTVIELGDGDIEELVAAKAMALGFTAVRQILEIEGLCDSCGIAAASA